MHKNSNLSVAFCVSYTYDALGRPVTRGADRFGYNGRLEVVSAFTDGIAANYAYDAVGNRLVSTNRLNGSVANLCRSGYDGINWRVWKRFYLPSEVTHRP